MQHIPFPAHTFNQSSFTGRICLLFVLVNIAAPLTGPIASAASFQDLGDIPFSIRDYSDDASVIVGNAFVGGNRGFRWEAGVTIDLGIEDSASAISADGAIIVGRDKGRAFRWDDGVVTILPLLSGSENRLHGAAAISPNGEYILGTAAFNIAVWTDSGLSLINSLEHTNFLEGISSDGSTIIGQDDGVFGNGAYRWQAGVTTFLGTDDARALAMSADGSVVVGSERSPSGSSFAFRWEGGVLSSLGSLSVGDRGTALDVSANGLLVVGTSRSAGDNPIESAFLWDETNGIQDLNVLLPDMYGIDLTGWQLTSAQHISADGKIIAGIGIGPNGSDTWVFTVPEPSTFFLMAISGCVLLVTQVRRIPGWCKRANLFCGIVLISFGNAAETSAASFIDLGPTGILTADFSDDATVLVGTAGSCADAMAVRWEAGITETLASPISSAHRVSDDGTTVLGQDQEYVVWKNGVRSELPQLPTYTSFSAAGISPNGMYKVGQAHGLQGSTSVLWDDDTAYDLGYASSPRLVNSDASVIVGTLGQLGFRWTESGVVQFGPSVTQTQGMSSDGSVVAGRADGRPMFWKLGDSEVTFLSDFDGVARGVSADGTLIVGNVRSGLAFSDPIFPFLWNADDGLQDLNSFIPSEYGIDLSNWNLTSVRHISRDGKTLAGFGEGPQGFSTWVLNVPEPSTMLLLLVGTGMCFVQRLFAKRK